MAPRRSDSAFRLFGRKYWGKGFIPFGFHVAIFFDMLSIALTVPLLSAIGTTQLGLSSFLFGATQALYGAMQTISIPVTGWLCDHYGPQVLLIMSSLGSSVAFAMLYAAVIWHSLPCYLAMRVIMGLFRQTMSISATYVVMACRTQIRQQLDADENEKEPETPESTEMRLVGQGLSRLHACSSAAFVLGPVLGGIGADVASLGNVVLASALICASNIALLWVFTNPLAIVKKEKKEKASNPISLFLRVLRERRPAVMSLLTTMLCCSFCSVVMHSVKMSILRDGFQWPFRYIGALVSFSGSCGAVASAVLLPRLLGSKAPWATNTRLTQSCMLVTLVSLLGVQVGVSWQLTETRTHDTGLTWSALLSVASMSVVAVTLGMSTTLHQAQLTALFASEESGEVLGISYSMDGCNRVISPLIMGHVQDVVGASSLLLVLPTIVWVAGMLSFQASLRIMTNQKQEEIDSNKKQA